MEKITEILLSEVEDESGRKYGRVFELRSEGDPEHGIVSDSRKINSILCGTTGLLQEFGFDHRSVTIVDWSEIVDIKPGKIVIRPPGKAAK
jgi:hypothetical protein